MMNTEDRRTLNRSDSQRKLAAAQLQAIVPVLSYLNDRLTENRVPMNDMDRLVLGAVPMILTARTDEEVETIVGNQADKIKAKTMADFGLSPDLMSAFEQLMAKIMMQGLPKNLVKDVEEKDIDEVDEANGKYADEFEGDAEDPDLGDNDWKNN